jgi:hypothetical protein
MRNAKALSNFNSRSGKICWSHNERGIEHLKAIKKDEESKRMAAAWFILRSA